MTLSLVLALLVAGCELFDTRTEEVPVEGIDYENIDEILFSEHVLPLVQQKFAPLLAAEAGLRLGSWADLLAGSDFGEILIPFNADHSLIVELATKQDGAGLGEDAPTAAEINFLRRWIDEGARNDAGEVPFEASTQRLYVCNQDDASIAVIDMQANVVMRLVELEDFGFTGEPKPHHVAVEPDGSHWYVSLIGANTVLKFDRQNQLVGQTAAFETPGMLAMHPTEDWLFAGRSLSAVDPPRSIGAIRRSDMTHEAIGVFFQRPHALRVSPDGRYVYTGSLVTNQLAAVEVATFDVDLTGLDGPAQAFLHMAIAPNSRRMYVTGQVAGQVSFLSLADPTRPTLLAALDVPAQPWHPVLSPDGNRLYFGNKGANAVTVVDTEARAVETIVEGPGLAQPHGAALRPDGRYLYISNNNATGTYVPRYAFGDNADVGTVVVIDTATNTIVKVLEVEALAVGMATR